MKINAIHNGNCLNVMDDIEDNSINCIIADLPFGITGNKWDKLLNMKEIWKHYNRIIKPQGAIILFGTQPITSLLVMSNIDMFRYELIWEKSRGSNFIHSKYQPLKTHENILVFSKRPAVFNKLKENNMNYYPQMKEGKPYKKGIVSNNSSNLIGTYKEYSGDNESGLRFPRSVLYFSSDSNGKYRGINSTQKPIDLLEYLIKSYSKKDDLILDNTAGSSSLAVACDNTERNWITIEMDSAQCEKAIIWVNDNRKKLNLPETTVIKH